MVDAETDGWRESDITARGAMTQNCPTSVSLAGRAFDDKEDRMELLARQDDGQQAQSTTAERTAAFK